MNMYDIITKKKHGEALSSDEINYFINGFTDGDIPDYQASALLMAICLKQMDDRETADLTQAMMHSGDMMDLSAIKGLKVDKHSTGGVGDKTSLVLTPMLAACGLTVAKMSGRGLGHTGGTIDKLESIPGFRTSLSEEEFMNIVATHHLAIAGQTKDIAPADKKLYALRDVTATVDDMSLIASSIMSKKLASGSDAIVLDVKTGTGSFAGSYENAVDLAQKMVTIGKNMNKKICAVISDMNQPLGNAVGNALEVKEAVETLLGNGPDDLLCLCLSLGSQLLQITGKAENEADAMATLRDCIVNGSAYHKFIEFVEAQGGDSSAIRDLSLLPSDEITMEVISPIEGFVDAIQCDQIGLAALHSGAGREVKDDPIDFGAGIMIHKKIGSKVKQGESIATVYAADQQKAKAAVDRILLAYHIGPKMPSIPPLIYKTIQ